MCRIRHSDCLRVVTAELEGARFLYDCWFMTPVAHQRHTTFVLRCDRQEVVQHLSVRNDRFSCTSLPLLRFKPRFCRVFYYAIQSCCFIWDNYKCRYCFADRRRLCSLLCRVLRQIITFIMLKGSAIYIHPKT